MTVHPDHLAELGRAVARADNDALLVLATAFVLAARAGGALAAQPGAREVLATFAAVVGSEQRDRNRTRDRARLDQANARCEGWWGPRS